ncbi:MAG: hypothetical protein V3W37_10605 [Candidatus Binatia bacterium]
MATIHYSKGFSGHPAVHQIHRVLMKGMKERLEGLAGFEPPTDGL